MRTWGTLGNIVDIMQAGANRLLVIDHERKRSVDTRK